MDVRWTRLINLLDVMVGMGLLGGICLAQETTGGAKAPLQATASVVDFGAKGDGKTDDREAIQKAIDAADVIHFPRPAVAYRVVGSLKIGGTDERGQKRLVGDTITRDLTQRGVIIKGEGGEPLFTTGIYPNGKGLSNRGVSLEHLSATNKKAAVVQFHSAVNFLVADCYLASHDNTDATISARYSYRGTIKDSTVLCSGGGFAITAYDNCNGLRVRDCTLAGGTAGGVLHLEQSQGCSFTGNVIEVSKYGLAVSTFVRPDRPTEPNVVGAGNCNGFECSGNYLETVEHPFLLATKGTIHGASIEANYVGTTPAALKEYKFTEQPIFRVGRLHGSVIRANSFLQPKGGTQPVIEASATAGAQFPTMQSTTIESNVAPSGDGPFFAADKAIQTQILKQNNNIQTTRGFSGGSLKK